MAQQHKFSFFCSVCKEHVEVHGENKKDAEKKFNAQGHEYIRIRRLRRGLPGVLKTQKQLDMEVAFNQKGVAHGT